MKLYGLFEYSYDYYEWESLNCVSYSQKSLVDRFHETIGNRYKLIYTDTEHEELRDGQVTHYMIKEVELI